MDRSKDGYAIQPSAQFDITADKANETYSLKIKKISVGDAGVYSVIAKNEIGETAQQARLTILSEYFKYYTHIKSFMDQS